MTPSRWLPDGRYLAADGSFDWEAATQRLYFVVLEWADGGMVPVDTIEIPDLSEPETVTFVSPSGRSRSTRYIPFVHVPSWRLEEGGRFWVWDGGGAYDIRLQSLSGDVIRRISRPYSPVRIGGDVRRRAIEDFERPGWRPETDFDASRVPKVYPPFSSVRLSPDGSVWVRRRAEDGQAVWEVFSEHDRYLGRLDVPEALEEMSFRHIGSDHLWGVLRDDLDVEYVVRARIVKPSG